MSFSIGGMFSGGVISSFKGLFISLPWILALYPSILSLRGDISGVLSGRISTMLHTGEVEPKFIGNTRDFYALIKSLFALTYIDSLAMGFLTFIINFLAENACLADLPYFALVPIVACLLSTGLSMPITLVTAFSSFRRGFDPDVVVYPVIAIMNDVLVAVSYSIVILLTIALTGNFISLFLLFAFLLLIIILIASRTDWKLRSYSSTIREATPVVILTSLDGVINGVILAHYKYAIQMKPEVIVVYPVLLNALGAVGSIIGSLTTTRLALGLLYPSLSSFKYLLLDVLGVYSSSLLLYSLYGSLAFAFCISIGLSVVLQSMILLCIMVGMVGVPLVVAVSFVIGIVAYNRGWDPDNLVIPIVSSLSDFLGTLLIVSLMHLL